MFSTPNLLMTMTHFKPGIRTKNDEHTHFLNVTFSLPLTWELAGELGENILRNMFRLAMRDGQETWVPKAELNNVQLLLLTGAYTLEMRHHPDMLPGPHDRVMDCRIAGVGASKDADASGGHWQLSFGLKFDVVQWGHIERMFKQWKLGTYVTLIRQDPTMQGVENAPPTVSSETGLMRMHVDTTAAPDGSVETSVDGEVVDEPTTPAENTVSQL